MPLPHPASLFARQLTALLLTGAGVRAGDASLSREDLAFFESQVRPILAERCQECHGERKQKGGLRLDSAPGWRTGGAGGAALEPGHPERSLLIAAIRGTEDDLRMPPEGGLPAAEIAVLTEWVRRGAPDPRNEAPSTAPARRPMTLEEARSHWAFQPIGNPPVPAAPGGQPDAHPIDRFVRARLAAEGLSPNPPADRRTLLRRAYQTLLGLPPSAERAEEFAADSSPQAWETLVDQLLARPEYGQRWGRHWLDVARYADTTDKSTDSERRIPFAHTYRDYVIEAFNADRPFDRFVREQVAADRLPAAERPDLRALGFLTVGRRFEGNLEAPELIIDDRIDTIGRGLLGLTLACARCHDHKFDAVSAADYYGLSGILASSQEPMDLPEVAVRGTTEAVEKYRAKRAELFTKYRQQVTASTVKARRLIRELAPEYLRLIVEESPNHRTVEGFIPLDTPRGLLVLGGAPRWRALIAESLRRDEPFFRLWPELLALPREGFADRAATVIAAAARQRDRHDAAVLAELEATPPASMHDVAAIFGRLIGEAVRCPDTPAPTALLRDPASPLEFTEAEVEEDLQRFVTEYQLVSRADGTAAGKILTDLTTLEAEAPVERAQALVASTQPVRPHVLQRGDRARPGAEVPRRLPRVLAARLGAEPFADDGRLQLARAIASPDNPLTARVIVNRVWQQHFGRGLVATADDFGATGEAPSHPELLDHLAHWFITHGWSLKALHRYVMTSATWQQGSGPQAAAAERDPGNRLLWRMSPRRLEFEALRDSLLRVSGQLDVRAGGRSAPLADDNVRRTVYAYTDRFRIPALQRNFDVANPDQSIARRAESIHPLQALFFLNSPFVRARAEAVNRQPDVAEQPRSPARVEALYRRILARRPDAAEQELAAGFLGASPTEERWIHFAQVLLLSNEFSHVD